MCQFVIKSVGLEPVLFKLIVLLTKMPNKQKDTNKLTAITGPISVT